MGKEIYEDLFENVVINGHYPLEKLNEMKSYIDTLLIKIEQLKNINEKISLSLESAENKIDKTIKHVSSLSSKGRDCMIYADVKKDILDILKGK